MGQYVFLNVPAISHFEWHPFSISSVADDPVTTHHIKCHGASSFTGKLKALVEAVEAADDNPERATGESDDGELSRARLKKQRELKEIGLPTRIKDININVEGPYGVPLEYVAVTSHHPTPYHPSPPPTAPHNPSPQLSSLTSTLAASQVPALREDRDGRGRYRHHTAPLVLQDALRAGKGWPPSSHKNSPHLGHAQSPLF